MVGGWEYRLVVVSVMVISMAVHGDFYLLYQRRLLKPEEESTAEGVEIHEFLGN